MDKSVLNDLAQGINLEYQIGVLSEIRSFFEHKQEHHIIHDASIKFRDNTYIVKMEMNHFNSPAAKTLFTEFVRFIEYPGATFYIIEASNYCVTYYLLSCTNDKKGMFSQIKIH
ncbi:hypothetical protein [Pseudoneobacillus rhizosphaerae]|uniref:Uncharacterized protein n=1 Tax=Pseudoneobacillus rhizosphaerae TaxID=2880968 RepID=A0A9C7GEH6_9BACI|nr:hypothetical protein [Pseudoneobacillus rhizosphaerae]CAG9610795.1 hypothetical protein NEOCIP111885_04573 [Pseudoneobacillus rhizosphaerae]